MLDKGVSEDHVRDLIYKPTLAAMTFDAVTNELLLIRHLTRIGKTLKKKASKKNKKVVALHGFGLQESATRFKSSNYLSNDDFITKLSNPADALWQ